MSNGAYFIFDNGNNFKLNIGSLDVSGYSDGSLNIDSNNEVNIKAGTVNVKGNVVVDGDFKPKNGFSGTFMAMANLVTVENGIVVAVQ